MSRHTRPSRESAASVPPPGSVGRSRFPGFFFRELNRNELLPVALFFGYAFLLLICYYILKTLREPLLLESGSAEIKSYANGTAALVLVFLVPVYSAASRCFADKDAFVRWVTGFFGLNLLAFLIAGSMGFDIGFAYYVWVGVFGVTILALFWGYAADAFDVANGKRLFPAIASGAALGGLIGPPLVGTLFDVLGPWRLMTIAGLVLTLTIPLIGTARAAIPESMRAPSPERQSPPRGPRLDRILGGLRLVLTDRYLLLLATFVVLLNFVNSIGEYLLAGFVVEHATAQVAADPGLARDDLIASFYGNFYFVVNGLTLVSQVLLVGRAFRWIGVSGSLLVLPLVAAIGYGLILIVPLFALIRVIKVIENAADYSVANTSRHALYLPLPSRAKYEGKMAIDTLVCRLGDFLQAGAVFAGVTWLGLDFGKFALLNVAVAAIWLTTTIRLGHHYRERAGESACVPRFRASIDAAVRVVARIASPLLAGCRASATALLTTVVALLALTLPMPADADANPVASVPEYAHTPRLFDSDEILELEARLDFKALCRHPKRRRCQDVPTAFVYADELGGQHRVEATIRSRGRYREQTGNCQFPALFVFFQGDLDDTLFAGESMLPLTTHCQHFGSVYDQYVVKEYLAYRIHNLLTDKSLRARLVHMTYHDTSGKYDAMTRYAIFVEHFESLARRHNAVVYEPEWLDIREADAYELAVHDLFQYMIGNTDFSVLAGHNILHIKEPGGRVSVVPYDFDFSGFVDAEYAGPSPKLTIRNVRQRLYRGFCVDQSARARAIDLVRESSDRIRDEIRHSTALSPDSSEELIPYMEEFFTELSSWYQRDDEMPTCREPQFGIEVRK